ALKRTASTTLFKRSLPEHGPSVVVDRERTVRAPGDERQRLAAEAEIADHDAGAERIELPRLIVERRLPSQLEPRLLHRLRRDDDVVANPRRALRIGAARDPVLLGDLADLRVQDDGRAANAHPDCEETRDH